MNTEEFHARVENHILGITQPHTRFPFRASNTTGCLRESLLSLMYPSPRSVNSEVGLALRGAAENILRQKIEEVTGIPVTFPWGEQRGPHDEPDYVLPFEDGAVDTAVAIAQNLEYKPVDGVESVPFSLDDAMKGISICHVDGISHMGTQLIELKCLDSYSFERQFKEGVSEGYRCQMAIQLAAAEFTNKVLGLPVPTSTRYLSTHLSGKVTQHYLMSLLRGEPVVEVVDTIPTTFYTEVFTPADLAEDLEKAMSFHKDMRFAWINFDEPAIPDGFDAGHWKCSGYCSYPLMCYQKPEVMKARESLKYRGKRKAKA